MAFTANFVLIEDVEYILDLDGDQYSDWQCIDILFHYLRDSKDAARIPAKDFITKHYSSNEQ